MGGLGSAKSGIEHFFPRPKPYGLGSTEFGTENFFPNPEPYYYPEPHASPGAVATPRMCAQFGTTSQIL